MQKICDAGCWLEIAYDPASQPASSSPPGNGLPPQLDGGWPPPPAAAPDPELRTIVGDGYQAATAAVPGAGAPFFAVLGLVPGRLDLKMERRTVYYSTGISHTTEEGPSPPMPPARASSATHLNAGAFRFGEVLGRGTCGVVYKVVSRSDNTEAVIKQINLGRLSRSYT